MVELARQLYAANPAIDATSQALMTIAEENPLFEQLDVQVSEISCTDPDYQPTEDDASGAPDAEAQMLPVRALEEEDEEALDEWEDGLYVCRWPNGEFSIVKAASSHENA